MRKLPVIATIQHALFSTFYNLRFAFFISWPWLLIVVPVNVTANINTYNSLKNPVSSQGGVDISSLVLSLFVMSISLLAQSSFAVNWHRYILLDEVPTTFQQRLRLDRLTLSYLGNTLVAILILLAMLMPIIIVFLTLLFGIKHSSLTPQQSFLPYLLLVIFTLGGIISILANGYRFLLKLPAIAIGRTDFTFMQAWHITRGNFGKFTGLYTLVILLTSVVLFISTIIMIGALMFGFLGAVLVSIGYVFIYWASIIFSVALLTSLYGFFAEDRNY